MFFETRANWLISEKTKKVPHKKTLFHAIYRRPFRSFSFLKMGKLKTRIKGPGSKGKRWAKGQSSSSNPTTNKHREVAKSRFFQPFLFGPPPGTEKKSGLTEEALKQHTYASQLSKVLRLIVT